MPVVLSHDAAEHVADIRQNMWRWAGNMTKAADVIRAWSAADPTNPTPELRLGEVDYLQKHYDDAAADFARAARRTRTANYRNDLGVDEALLPRAAALLAADRASESSRILRDAESDASLGVAYQTSLGDAGSPGDFATVAYYARVKLADQEREAGQLHAAAEDYAAAEEVLPLTGNRD
jgi:tetratricopeptide (TPR) repeat protein